MKLKAALLPFLLLLTGADPNNSPQATAAKHSRMKADYVEACSCHLFCPCYFNKHAEHKSCKFNMAVKVREGHSGATNLAGSKYWLTGDLGENWGTQKKADWVTVSFDPSTSKAQRDALARIESMFSMANLRCRKRSSIFNSMATSWKLRSKTARWRT